MDVTVSALCGWVIFCDIIFRGLVRTLWESVLFVASQEPAMKREIMMKKNVMKKPGSRMIVSSHERTSCGFSSVITHCTLDR